MRGPKPPPIMLTPTQRETLKRLERRQRSSQQLVRRVRIVLQAASGASNTRIAGLLGIDRGQVRTWGKRWLECAPRLIAGEEEAKEKAGEDVDDRDGSTKGVLITEVVEEVLADEPRPGRPPTFTPEQVVRIVALACENPREESGRPITHWTPPELADEAVKRGSKRASRPAAWGVFWGEADLRPHLVRPWKHNERAAEPEIFDREVSTVCECYAEALRLHEEGVHLVSTDEKTSIQALERLHPSLAMRPGLIERYEHEYVRHGTRTLIANFEVATGRVITPSIGKTRTNEDFASHIEKTIATDPDARWVFVVDQLNEVRS